jgi:hypothetical protein
MMLFVLPEPMHAGILAGFEPVSSVLERDVMTIATIGQNLRLLIFCVEVVALSYGHNNQLWFT